MNIIISILSIIGIAKIVEILLHKFLYKEKEEVELDSDKFKVYKEQIVFLNEEMSNLTEKVKERQKDIEDLNQLVFQLNCKLCDLETRVKEEQEKNRKLQPLVCFSINCKLRQQE